jgi:malonyl-CoA O-methyltransferase
VTAIPRKSEIRRAFERAAPTYDSAAQVQREAATRLFAFGQEHVPSHTVRRVLDAGCGTGQALARLGSCYPGAQILALDFSAAMLTRARACLPPTLPPALPLCADIEHLPLAKASIDLYWSNLAVQWCAPQAVLREIHRVLAPGGIAWIATLGPRTLHELRAAFTAVDASEHVIAFISPEKWHDAAHAAGFHIRDGVRLSLRARAPDLKTLLADIKAIGAHTIGERRRMLGRQGWQKLQTRYEAFREPGGALPATYDLLLFVLRKPA